MYTKDSFYRLHKLKVVIWIIMLSPCSIIFGQQIDSIFTYEEFISIVKEQHPLTFSAGLRPQFADANEMMARGNFDPKLEFDNNLKNFDDKNYYRLIQGGLKIPTWFGAEIKMGYDNNTGEFLSASDELPPRGLWNAGISFPLARGLVIDGRRAELKKALIFQDLAEQERILLLNEIILDASLAYIRWQESNARLDLALQGRDLAQQRFDIVKVSFELGDQAAMDTLEAFVSLNTRERQLVEAINEFESARINLQNFLWLDGYIPLELNNDQVPSPFDDDFFRFEFDSVTINILQQLDQHPELMAARMEIDQMKVQRRLEKENLKPNIELMFNPLASHPYNDVGFTYNADDLKFGARFNYSPFLRKERGKLRLTDLKIQEKELSVLDKGNQIKNKVLIALQNHTNFLEQQRIVENNVANYFELLRMENIKFSIGESSIFLLNTRESKFIESNTKLIELKSKLLKNRIYGLYSAGALAQ